MAKYVNTTLLVAALTLGVGSASVVEAENCTFTATSGIWASSGNWSCSGSEDIPNSDDHALIPSGKTCAVDADADAKSVTLYGTLDIESEKTLTMHGSSGTSTVNIESTGTLNLEGCNSVLEFLVDGFIVPEGSPGKLIGAHNDAKIILADETTLTSRVIIEGHLQITEAALADATFINEETVHANTSDGTLYINTDVIDDDGTALWKVSTSSSAVLKLEPKFGASSPDLSGDFEIRIGTLDIQKTVVTTGRLEQYGGTISVASGAAVEFNHQKD